MNANNWNITLNCRYYQLHTPVKIFFNFFFKFFAKFEQQAQIAIMNKNIQLKPEFDPRTSYSQLR